MPLRFELSAGGVVYRPAPGGCFQVILIATQGGQRWGLPKGHVERGESLQAAALREVREETGVRATVAASLGSIQYWYWMGEGDQRERHLKKVYFYLLSYLGGDLRAQQGEIEDLSWFPIPEAMEAMSYDTERDVLARAQAWLVANQNNAAPTPKAREDTT